MDFKSLCHLILSNHLLFSLPILLLTSSTSPKPFFPPPCSKVNYTWYSGLLGCDTVPLVVPWHCKGTVFLHMPTITNPLTQNHVPEDLTLNSVVVETSNFTWTKLDICWQASAARK
jgi:hypothetical protein